MCLKLVSCLFVFSFGIVARATVCTNALQSQVLTFNAFVEAGSIESRYPGTLARLRVLADKMFNLRSESQASENLSQEIHQIIRDFNKLKNFNPDARFQTVHRHFSIELQRFIHELHKNKTNPNRLSNSQHQLNKIGAAFWELMAACLFDGERIFLGMRVGQLAHLMPEEFKHIRSGNAYDERFASIREIDITILNKDGSWRWIEVKNWGQKSAMDPHSMEKLFEQSAAHNRIRTLLKLPIRFELVMRYQLPQAEHDLYLEKSSYEKIHYFFR